MWKGILIFKSLVNWFEKSQDLKKQPVDKFLLTFLSNNQGAISRKPWNPFGPEKPFLVNLYLKTEV